jgi:hypothetical protein
MDQILIMGLVAYAVEVTKGYIAKQFIPALVIGFAMLFSALSAVLMGDTITPLAAVKEGLMLGAVASGIYGMGKVALEKPKTE